MKKIAIVADNYKVSKFKEQLKAKGFDDIKTTSFTPTSTTIMVNTEDDKIDDIRKICQLVEMHFKRSN